jgi:hypothetical protein
MRSITNREKEKAEKKTTLEIKRKKNEMIRVNRYPILSARYPQGNSKARDSARLIASMRAI